MVAAVGLDQGLSESSKNKDEWAIYVLQLDRHRHALVSRRIFCVKECKFILTSIAIGFGTAVFFLFLGATFNIDTFVSL